MKYCMHCGAEMDDSAAFCSRCGAPVEIKRPSVNVQAAEPQKPGVMKVIAEVFMVLGCVELGALLIPLCWTIPMTVKYFKAVKEGKDVSTGFKVCSLIFVSMIAGILMLVADEVDD